LDWWPLATPQIGLVESVRQEREEAMLKLALTSTMPTTTMIWSMMEQGKLFKKVTWCTITGSGGLRLASRVFGNKAPLPR